MRRILELGDQKPHEKEPANAWVFRVLSLHPERDRGTELQLANGHIYYGPPGADKTNRRLIFDVSREAVQAIESWMRFGHEPDDHARGVSVAICNQSATAFLLQRKDLKHPVEACRGRYCLFGGSCHTGEEAIHAAWRELLEEIRFRELHSYLHLVQHIGDHSLDSVQWPGSFTSSLFLLRLPNDVFDRLTKFSAFYGDVSESVAVIMTRHEFSEILLPQEKLETGRHFVSSHHLLIEQILHT